MAGEWPGQRSAEWTGAAAESWEAPVKLLEALRTVPVDGRAALLSGLAAGTAFVAVLKVDLRLTGNNVDDRLLLGRPLVRDPERALVVGSAVHYANSAALALLYARLAHRFPGPPWLRGVLFFNVENLAFYPVLVFEEWHPAIRDGQLDRYWTWPSFLQSIPRHIAYGAVLGVLYDRLRRR